MQKRSVIGGFILSLAIAGLTSTAFADIKAFNAAVKAGDYKKAAVEAKDAWGAWDMADPDTAVVAREFGFAALVAKDYALAKEFGQFLKDRGGSLVKPDEQPATSAVLLRVAEHQLDTSGASRAALLTALNDRARMAGLDNITLLAAEALYRSDWNEAAWAQAIASADLAANLMARGGASVLAKTLEARLYSGAADFLVNSAPNDYDKLASVHDDVIDAIDATTDQRLRKTLINLKFQAEAWTDIAAIGLGSKAQIGSNIPRSPRYRELKKAITPLFPGQPMVENPDECEGKMSGFDMKFAHKVGSYRSFGVVLVRMSFDEYGRATSWETLASIPSPLYGDALKAQVSNIRRMRSSEDKSTCLLTSPGRVITVIF